MTDREKIRAEVERRITALNETNSPREQSVKYECEDILRFIDSLPNEPVIEDLVQEYDKEFYNDPVFGKLVNRTAGIGVARHFANWQYQKDRLEFAKLKAKEWQDGFNAGVESKEQQMMAKDKAKIDRKVLFEICDAILSHDGYADRDDCPENESDCFWYYWDKDFLKKVENIRKNS